MILELNFIIHACSRESVVGRSRRLAQLPLPKFPRVVRDVESHDLGEPKERHSLDGILVRVVRDNALWERSLVRRNPSTAPPGWSTLTESGCVCVGDSLGASYGIKRKRTDGRMVGTLSAHC